jgi:hypothetical protein
LVRQGQCVQAHMQRACSQERGRQVGQARQGKAHQWSVAPHARQTQEEDALKGHFAVQWPVCPHVKHPLVGSRGGRNGQL